MLKTKKKQKILEGIEIIGVTCDFCGNQFDKTTVEFNGYGRIVIGFGFGSAYDDERWIAEICDKCFEKHFKKKLRCENR